MLKLWNTFIAGTYGISHGTISLAIIVAAWALTYSYLAVVIAAVGTAYYWARREAKARGTWTISEWYLDSQLDAIVPGLVSLAAIVMVLWYH